MKTISNKILIVLVLVFAFYSCGDDDMTFKDTKVTAVNKLYAPSENAKIQLISASGSVLTFEWEASKAEDSGAPIYEVLFDKVDGDFSAPIYKTTSDMSGFRNMLTVSHSSMNKICALAGIEFAGTGKIKWTVVSSRGLNEAMAKEERVIEVSRLVGFEVFPTDLFLSGEGTEAGTNLSEALNCASIGIGEFEIFTKLEAGKTYTFTDKKVGGAETKTFNFANGKIIGDGEAAKVSKTAVYRIVMNFELATYAMFEVKSIGVFFCPSNKVILDLPYAGKGVWTAQGNITFKDEGSWKDERYKFQMEVIDAENSTIVTHLGTKNGTDSRPNANSPESYYFIKEFPASEWNDKWKFATEMDGAKVEVSVLLTGSDYTHTVTKIG